MSGRPRTAIPVVDRSIAARAHGSSWHRASVGLSRQVRTTPKADQACYKLDCTGAIVRDCARASSEISPDPVELDVMGWSFWASQRSAHGCLFLRASCA
jgi:hypothetical protein